MRAPGLPTSATCSTSGSVFGCTCRGCLAMSTDDALPLSPAIACHKFQNNAASTIKWCVHNMFLRKRVAEGRCRIEDGANKHAQTCDHTANGHHVRSPFEHMQHIRHKKRKFLTNRMNRSAHHLLQ